MRLAAAPGRLARPAPPCNDDPCVEKGRRTILEGLPDNGKHGPGPEIPRGAPKGERPVAGNARRLTQAGLARFAQIDRTPGPPVVRNERKAGFAPGLRIERGVCASVMTRRDGCLACIRAPPALRPPLVRGSE